MFQLNNPIFAVFLIAVGMALVSVNDTGFALLEEGGALVGGQSMPLMQAIAGRALFGLVVIALIPGAIAGVLALSAGAWAKLLARGTILVGSMMTYFLGLSIFEVWEMSAIFFVCPVLISLLSVPLLGEQLGIWRILAVLIGLAGVFVILLPDMGFSIMTQNGALVIVPPDLSELGSRLGWSIFFPLGSAFFYAIYQIVTRMMRNDADALVMSVVQIFTYFLFGAVLGGILWALPLGYTEGTPGAFLLRDWVVPTWQQTTIIAVCAAIVLFLSFVAANAYRVAEAAYVAPFEYTALPFAIFFSGIVWGTWPDVYGYVGTAMIIGAGLLIILRERQRNVDVVTSMPMGRAGAFSVAAVDEREPIWVDENDHLV